LAFSQPWSAPPSVAKGFSSIMVFILVEFILVQFVGLRRMQFHPAPSRRFQLGSEAAVDIEHRASARALAAPMRVNRR